MKAKKIIGALAILCMLTGTTALAADPGAGKAPTNAQATKEKEKPLVIQNAVLDEKAKQSIEKMKTILPDLKGFIIREIRLTRTAAKSYYTIAMSKSKELTYPSATLYIMENTGEVKAFSLQKDRPTYPADYLNNFNKTPELEKARKVTKAAADKLMAQMLGKNAANYVANDVNFGASSDRYTTVGHMIYNAKVQDPNAPLDSISIQIDASGAPVMFLHYF
ncbi:hypothetical protein ACTID9_04090 [Brevibacillus fluminis]|uniref:hypothetical protein n=1 Tax=Brevibacillus fluminis TaxID=511487 RepID=UPI003F8BC7D6